MAAVLGRVPLSSVGIVIGQSDHQPNNSGQDRSLPDQGRNDVQAGGASLVSAELGLGEVDGADVDGVQPVEE